MEESIFIRITKLDWDYKTGGVVTAHWDMVASDGVLEGVDKKKTDFDPNPESKNFVPVENLTEETVISWIKDTVMEEQLKIYEDRAVSLLRKSKLPPLVSGLPWDMS